MERPLDPSRLGDHLDRLYRAAWAFSGSREEAEDLVQETYARVLARPRLLRRLATAPLVSDNPGPLPHGVSQADLVFSPDGQILASVSGRDEVTLWNLARPDRATRIATLAGPRDYFAALAFSPRGNLLAAVTIHGTVLVYSLADPARPAELHLLPPALEVRGSTAPPPS